VIYLILAEPGSSLRVRKSALHRVYVLLEFAEAEHARGALQAVEDAKDRVVLCVKVLSTIEGEESSIALVEKLGRFILEFSELFFFKDHRYFGGVLLSPKHRAWNFVKILWLLQIVVARPNDSLYRLRRES